MLKAMTFYHLQEDLEPKYGKKIDGYCNKNRNRCCKNCRSKTAKTTGDLIGNKIADKITSVDKTKSNAKDETKISTYHPKKIQEIIDHLRLF